MYSFLFFILSIVSVAVMASNLNTARIEELTHLKGKLNEKEGVFKVTYPRSDLNVVSNGVKITPAMGLTAWTSFVKMGNHVMVMGDIVMTEGQVNDVMSVALNNSLEVTALHNHFFGDTPKIMFMHISGMGDEEKLASAVGAVFDTLKSTTTNKFQSAALDPAKTKLDPKKIDEVMGTSGELNSGVYKLTIGRTTKMSGQSVGNGMGVNTWAAFVGSDRKAVVDGDFAMLESELQNVLKTLRKNNINIVAIHNHMTTEDPRLVFLHFWGICSTIDLAKGLKAALDTQK